MLIKHLKMFHSRNSLNDSGFGKLSVNLFETKCLILSDNTFQTNSKQTHKFIPNQMFNTIKLFFIKY